MCISNFSKVLIGNSEQRNKMMILCRNKDRGKKDIQKLIRKGFPELFEGLGFIRRALKIIPCKVEHCYKMYSSQFDCQIGPLEKNHNWDKNPFMALRVFEENGKTYCSAEPITI